MDSSHERRLPHWHPEGCHLHVVFRLAGSLPGQPGGPSWLSHHHVASLVTQAIRDGDQQHRYYTLRAFVLMPNHVHLLIRPEEDQSLSRITQWLKGNTARQANLHLNRTGQIFWQRESYDHWIRTRDELEHTARYIEANPVRAGLCASPEAWPWSSAALSLAPAFPSTLRP